MNACHEFLEMMSASLDQMLSLEQQTRLENHLAECQDCRGAFKELQRTHSQIKGLKAVEPPPWLASKIMARIRSEAAPQASFWRRFIRPIILKPQLQVASILLLAATGFYLLKSQRSESDVFREMKQPPAPAPMQSQPGKPVEAHDKVAQEPRSAPKEMQNPLSEGVNKLRMEESKPSESGFAPPPPPAQTPKAEIAKQERDMEPSKPSALPAPAPSLLAGAAVGGGTPATAEATAPTARQTKKSLKGADSPARVNRADEMAKEKSHESSGQLMDQADRKDKNDSATWIIRMEIPDPRSAKALIERELAKIGATLISQRESGTPHVVRARLDSRRLPELLSRLARIGKVLEQPDFTSEKSSQILISIHW